MTMTTERPAPPAAPPRGRALTAIALAVALAAGAFLLIGTPGTPTPAPPPTRASATVAWPGAARADLPAGLPDGPLFNPSIFLDATTAVGTAPTPSGDQARLLLRSGSEIRELRRVPLDGNPQFEAFTVSGDQLFWTESTAGSTTVKIWTANLSGNTARLLTADTGNAVFYGNQYDLVVAQGRVHWTAAPAKGDSTKETEIRSVAVTGGPVRVKLEPGQWSLSAWPWLVDDGSASGTPRLRNMTTTRDSPIVSNGTEQLTCGPVWCRAMVLGGDVVARIDLVRPDGTDRRRIAGGAAQSAITDVAVLDRFEILAEPTSETDMTGTAALVVYDVATGRTIDVAPAADGAFSRAGMLWWSTTTGSEEITWHSLDLRTV
ncbi:hypothetical protein [Paractinoplanes atraurantiacus]|uniref:WD40-like Beta Propeller Repeat n=1 Tax=Paractinoplanes atraurantiacus TaxID=1036182 RepID=A0A285IKL7_9ACTN|nr:hypothetical protein [Actinoplanes atraurantiacus]SNY48508.1 hypothetical protein SAMN05421748_10913 [Actinoplanes atraurantiacus]